MIRKKAKEDVDYSLIPESLWHFFSICFGVDYELARPKDNKNSGFFRTVYKIKHDNHLKFLILPTLDQITEDTLGDIGKPKKIYYNANTTFADVKGRLIKYLNYTVGLNVTKEDVHLWKPEFKYTIKSTLYRMILENKKALDEEPELII